MKTLSKSQFYIMLGLWVLILAISAIHPKDFPTWLLEVAPVLIAFCILIPTREKFPFPRYVMIWIFLHGVVLIIGGHYTYAEVPIGFWVKDLLHWERNPYDRLGHLMQGFVPALVAREILFRKAQIHSKAWLFFLTVTVCMGISAFYEFIEWWVALLFGEGSSDFLGTQGDEWDTQWDMFLATIGAILAQLIYRSEPKTSLTRS